MGDAVRAQASRPTAVPGDAHGPDYDGYERFKRRMYALGAVPAVAILLLSWMIRDRGDLFVTFLYPLAAATVVVSTVLMYRRVLPILWFEWGMIAAMFAFVFARLYWLLYVDEPIDARFETLTAGHYWSIGLLVVASFALLSWRAAIITGMTAIASSAMLAAGAIPGLITRDHAPVFVVSFIVRIHVFLLLLLILTSVVAVLREQLSQATTRAEMLESLAGSDPLTGLANRRTASAHLSDLAQRQQDVALITVDIDYFKAINDRYGHGRGDEVLVAFAALLADSVRNGDLVARWGGEEFLIIAPGSHADGVALAERCRTSIADGRPGGLEVTATFGVTLHDAGGDVAASLRRADQLLYEAKRSGRNRVESDHGGR